jgi:oligosaccharide 4-alpha-D-glucosyltransferase
MLRPVCFLVVCRTILFMKKIALLFPAIFYFVMAFSQKASSYNTYPSVNGRFQIIQYDSNIYKIRFIPKASANNENLSDAVILKQVAVRKKGKVHVSNDSIFINSKLVISGVHNNEGNKGFYFPLEGNEKIYGGGERAISLNRRGARLNLYNNPWYGYSEGADNLNYSVPFITSSNGYGLFFDNPSRGYMDIGKKQNMVLEYGAMSGELNVYLILGNYQQVLESYHRLTGTQPLPPRWALGNLMSRFGYTSEKQVKEIYSEMKKFNVPVDAIIYDLFWFGDSIKGTLGNLDWVNRVNWPDPKRMIRDFKKEGVQTILVTEPFFVETSKNYRASLPFLAVDSNRKPYYLTDFYFGKGGLVDIFRKDARQWFWSFYKKQMDMGIEAWWGDLGEPEKHPSNLFHNLKDLGYKRLFNADEVHNIYGHYWTKMLYSNYAKDFPGKRLFSLNRSGFAGSQRYSIFPWTGDVSRSWSGYRAQLPVLLGMSMSGVPYVHSDAGGFAGGEGDKELYVRWLQFAAFTPIFRPHGTALYDLAPGSFSFPSEAALMDSMYREAAIAAVHTRYKFLPYNYTLAYHQTVSGKPLLSPLYYYFPADSVAAAIEDQYMWGEQVMVAPVLHKGADTRSYYLPAGNWYHYYSGKVLKGSTWHTDTIDLFQFPLLIREGSFLPLDLSAVSNTAGYKMDSLVMVHVPSSSSSSSFIFDDDGRSTSSITGRKFQQIIFSSNGTKNKKETITIKPSNSTRMKAHPARMFLFIPGHDLLERVEVNGREVMNHSTSLRVNNYSKGWLIPFVQRGPATKISLFYK